MANFDHENTRFPLVGRHQSLPCSDCHLGGDFEGAPLACEDCHQEPLVHAGLYSENCAACHTPSDWSALVSLQGAWFDHYRQTGFSLNRHVDDYTGVPILCSGCHTAIDGYKLGFTIETCIDCHLVEAPAFMADHRVEFGMDCMSCHDGFDRMIDLDHDRFYELDGQHVIISCDACHVERIFEGTPTECSACHDESEIHAGYFGLQCERCHSTDAWVPAKLVLHLFPLDHGGQDVVACEVCHTDRYTEYTCYDCHEHQEGEVIEKHREEGITGTRFEDCMACHPTGLESEDEEHD
jgi:hypothetical protein